MGLGGVRVGERQEQAGRLRGLLSDERVHPQREGRARQRRARRRQPGRQPLRARALRAARRAVQEVGGEMTATPEPISASRLYKPAMALDFFKQTGKPERVPAGETIFAEGKKGLLFRDKMYLLISGEVDLLMKKKPFATLRAGEIFGELAAIDGAPRTASAVAKTPCKLIGLDEKQFYAALRKKPAFALMLMSVMISRLRDTITRLLANGDI